MPDSQPHIILITLDEWHRETLGCYSSSVGGRAIDTPAMDSLARDGVLFERAYAPSPWCLPSRCAMLTGLWSHNSGAYSNFRDCRPSRELPNLYNQLGAAGYATSHVGKCHYAPVPYSETRPDATLPYDAFRDYYLSLGIDQLDLQDDKQVSVWFRDDYADELDQAGHLEAYRAAVWDRSRRKVFDFPGPAEWHPDAWVGRRACERVRQHDADQPLFMWVSFSGPHYPFDAPAEYLDRVRVDELPPRVTCPGEYDAPDRIHHTSYHGPAGIDGAGQATPKGCGHYSDAYWRDLLLHYYGNMALIDDQIGALLAAIDEELGDNVVVYLTADHGEMLGHHGLWGKNNCVYEDVWRVPMIARGPGYAVGRREDALVSTLDITASCVAHAGAASWPMDSRPLDDVLAEGGRDYVVGEGEGYLSVSDGRWKLVELCNKDASGYNALGATTYRELFDLETDPDECVNRIADPACADVPARLRGELVDLLMRGVLA